MQMRRFPMKTRFNGLLAPQLARCLALTALTKLLGTVLLLGAWTRLVGLPYSSRVEYGPRIEPCVVAILTTVAQQYFEQIPDIHVRA